MQLTIEVTAAILLILLAFWKKDGILYLLITPVAITFGLGWYDTYETPAGFTFALTIFILATYMFALGIKHLLSGRFQ